MVALEQPCLVLPDKAVKFVEEAAAAGLFLLGLGRRIELDWLLLDDRGRPKGVVCEEVLFRACYSKFA